MLSPLHRLESRTRSRNLRSGLKAKSMNGVIRSTSNLALSATIHGLGYERKTRRGPTLPETMERQIMATVLEWTGIIDLNDLQGHLEYWSGSDTGNLDVRAHWHSPAACICHIRACCQGKTRSNSDYRPCVERPSGMPAGFLRYCTRVDDSDGIAP